VSDGGRTRDNRDHNPVLYQLSYTHHVQAAVYGTRYGNTYAVVLPATAVVPAAVAVSATQQLPYPTT
jgi:hypothetical protein